MIEIPNKLFFKIGEVARLANVEPSVLRFWQKEFKQLNPSKGKNGQRRYSRKDVDLVLKIAHLRYIEKYSLDGIKKIINRKELQENILFIHQERKRRAKKLFNNAKKIAEEIIDILNRL